MGKKGELYHLTQPKSRDGVYYYKLIGWTKYLSTGTRDKKEALDIVRSALGRCADFSPGTLGVYLSPYYGPQCPKEQELIITTGKGYSPNHKKESRRILEKIILEDQELTKIKLSALNRGSILAFAQRLVKSHGQTRMAQKAFQTLVWCIRHIVQAKNMAFDPTAGIKNIAYTKKEREAFSREELEKIFTPGVFQDKTYEALFYLCFSAGLRISEALALQWSDLEGDSITIQRAFEGKNTDGTKSTKTGSVDSVKLPKKALELLSGLDRNSFLMFHKGGQRIIYSTARNHFVKALEKAGLDRDGRSIHSLRHSLATLLLEEGVDPIKASKITRHSNVNTLMKHYEHVEAPDVTGIVNL